MRGTVTFNLIIRKGILFKLPFLKASSTRDFFQGESLLSPFWRWKLKKRKPALFHHSFIVGDSSKSRKICRKILVNVVGERNEATQMTRTWEGNAKKQKKNRFPLFGVIMFWTFTSRRCDFFSSKVQDFTLRLILYLCTQSLCCVLNSVWAANHHKAARTQ